MPIKPTFLLILLCGLALSELCAQNSFLGFRASGGLSTFSGRDANADLLPRIGGSTGVYWGIPFSEEWHFRPELSYALRGTDSDSLLISLHFAELTLPLYYLFAGEYLRFEASAGPSAGYLTRADNSRNPITEFFKKYNIAMRVSGGLRWEFASWQYLSAEVVYRWGLLSIAADTDFQAKTSFLGASLRYSFVF